LDDKTWSDARNNERLLNDHSIKTWELFYFANPNCRPFHIGKNLRVTAIHIATKSLIRMSLKNPEKLTDIAWTTALNFGLLEHEKFKLPKKLHYFKYF
jgi:hypothetical protein